MIEIPTNSDTDLLVEAFYRGSHWNPAYPNLRNLDLGRVLKMDGSESDAKQLIASRQQSDINIELLVRAFHKGREVQYDGDIGPATRQLAKLQRCPMPDFAPPPEASFDYEDSELNAAVESYQRFAEARGSGSWPVGCDPQAPNVHSVVVAIDTSNASSTQKGMMDEVLKMVEQTEAEIGQSVRHVRDGSARSPQHDVKFQNIPGGVIGFAYFPRPDSCNQTVTARIDNTFNPRATILAELLTHEYKGHSDGLEHTRGGIMNPSIGSPTVRASWKGDPHERTKTRYFGGVAIPTSPTPQPQPPGPGPTPQPGKASIRGTLTVEVGGKSVGNFIVVPASEV